jgi:hypothetical protein
MTTASTTSTGSKTTAATMAPMSRGPLFRRTRRGGSTSDTPVLGRANPVQVAAGRAVGSIDPGGDAGEVAVPQIGGAGRGRVPRGQDVHRDTRWKRGQTGGEPVTAGDAQRRPSRPPRAGSAGAADGRSDRRAARRWCRHRARPPGRPGCCAPSLGQVVLALERHRRQQSGDRVRAEHGIDQGTLGDQRSAARSMLAATQWNGTCCSAKVCTGRCASSRCRSGSGGCTCVRVRTRVLIRPSTDPPKMCREANSSHTARNWSTALGAGSAATSAPLIAPTDVPTIRSGRTWSSNKACSIPTSAAPSTPPPPRTNAAPPRPAGTCGEAMAASRHTRHKRSSSTTPGDGRHRQRRLRSRQSRVARVDRHARSRS